MIEAPGNERTHVLNPPPGGLTHAHFRLWIPDGQAALRGVICISDHATGQLYGDARWRNFAAAHGLALVLMSLRRPPVEPGVTNVAPDADGHGALLRALEYLGEKSRHPELEDCPRVFTGLGKSAQQAQAYADLSGSATLAVIPWQGGGHLNYREALTGDAAKAPQLHASAELDRTTAPADIAAYVAEAFALGLPWTHLVQGNLEYQLVGDPALVFTWLAAVMKLRLPKESGRPLRPIVDDGAWAGFISFGKDGHSLSAKTPVQIFALEKTKEKQSGLACWLPDAATAKAWQTHCLRKDANDPGVD